MAFKPISNLIVFLIGKTGTGKSTALNYILRKEYELKRREGIVVLDFRQDHLNLLNLKDFKYCKITRNLFYRYKIDWTGYLAENPYLIIDTYLSGSEYGKLANDIAGGILTLGNRIFVIEEAGWAYPSKSTQRNELSAIITTGRKLGIDCYFTSQRPSFVNILVMAEANIRICFLLDDIPDLQRVQGYFPNQKIDKLERFEFIAERVFDHKIIKGNTNNLSILDDFIWK